jgi:FkbM family methyltransferase
MKNLFIRLLQKIYRAIHGLRKTFLPFLKAKHLPFANFIIGQIMGMRMTRITTKQGFTLYLDDADSLALSYNKEYEAEETQFFIENIKEGMRVVDVGANIGYYTTLFSRLVGPSGSVIAFEPDPTNFSLLEKNCKTNGCRNVTLENLALSDRDGEAKLHLSDVNRGDHRMSSSDDSLQTIVIKTVRLADYLKQDDRFDLLKMDIQGHEFHALKGMGDLLDAKKVTLVMEFWPEELKKAGSDPVELLEHLISRDFEIRDSENESAVIEAEQSAIWAASVKYYTNLIIRK